jgi:dipeptidyl aminopeptidase/acylaminoacyl peptidase
VSSDGKSVAFQLSRADLATNSYCYGLVVASLDRLQAKLVDEGGDFIPLTAFVRGLSVNVGLPRPTTPAWSPDGRTIAYLRREKGVTQAFVAAVNGSHGRQVTHSNVDIEELSWTANGEALLVASRPAAAAAEAAIDRGGRSGWLYDERVATNEGPRPRVRESEVPLERFVVNVADGSVRPVTKADADAADRAAGQGNAGWRPFLRQEGSSLVSPERLWAAGPRGRETACGAPACLGAISGTWWDAKHSEVRFLRREGWDRESYAFYAWRPGSSPPVRTYATLDVIQNCLPAAGKLVCTVESSTSPRRIVMLDPASGARKLVFDPNPEFAHIRLGKVRRLRWRNDRGLEAWGDFVLPPNYRTGQKLPMIVVQYHSRGFLRGGTGDEYPIYLLAARGFAVLSFERPPDVTESVPNLRTEVELIRADEAGWAERRSMLSALVRGVELAVATGAVDPRRLGITGLSDGATSVRFALINSDLFAAAAISSCCIEPKTSMTYGGIAWAEFNRAVGYPPATVDDEAFWRPVSLTVNAARIRTPLLMQLSDDEYLLSLEAFEALRENHAPVELYVFPDEHHVKWQPVHRLAAYGRAVDWFDFWLRCEEDSSPAKEQQYRRWRPLRAGTTAAALCPASATSTSTAPTLPRRRAASREDNRALRPAPRP